MKNIHRETLRLYWAQVKHYKTSFFVMMFAIPFGQVLLTAVMPYFIGQLIGTMSTGQYDATSTILAWLVITGVLSALTNFIGFQAMVTHEANVISNLRNATFDKLIRKDVNFFLNQKVGGLTSKYIDFIRNHVGLQDLLVIRTIGFVVSVLIGTITIGMKSIGIAVLVLAFLALISWQIRWSLNRRKPLRQERRDMRSKIHGHIADSVTNYMNVKTFANEGREYNTMKRYAKRFDHLYRKDFQITVGEGSARVALMIVIQLTTLFLCIAKLKDGTMDIATTVFIVTYLQWLGSQLFVLGDLLNGYEEMLTDSEPMTTMLLHENTITDTAKAKTITFNKPTLELRNISYSYSDGDRSVVKDLSLTIPAGQKIGIVGPSGAGKSTLTHLLLRFDDVQDGAITIDGHDVRTITQKSLRDAIGYVPQESLLFHRSLRENIAYGKPDATDEEIIASAKKAHAWEFIKDLPNGLDTEVGERGVKLSGGQRQRVAIARAILKNAPIMVLDEATSALDSESEKLIQASLTTLMKGRTSIVIAHRLSTISKLDRIIVMDNGKILEDGTHEELLQHNKTYAKLWNHQSGGFING